MTFETIGWCHNSIDMYQKGKNWCFSTKFFSDICIQVVELVRPSDEHALLLVVSTSHATASLSEIHPRTSMPDECWKFWDIENTVSYSVELSSFFEKAYEMLSFRSKHWKPCAMVPDEFIFNWQTTSKANIYKGGSQTSTLGILLGALAVGCVPAVKTDGATRCIFLGFQKQIILYSSFLTLFRNTDETMRYK